MATPTASGTSRCPVPARLPRTARRRHDLADAVLPVADGRHGYDVTDPRDVDPTFGDLGAFDRLVEDASAHRIRVVIDLVPGNTSNQHPWFGAALAAGPGSPQRDRYVFREGRGYDGSEPPNNWTSVQGGPAWTRVPDGQWYLHLFSPEQPDLNWAQPGRGRRLRTHHAVLAGTRRRGLPDQPGARHHQTGAAARHGPEAEQARRPADRRPPRIRGSTTTACTTCSG